VLTPGEVNSFAGYGPSGSGKMTLRQMAVMVTLEEGESLKLGIRSGNFKADGTRSTGDSHGWFKVDHFRLQRIDATEIPSNLKDLKAQKDPMDLNGQCYDLQGRMVNGQWSTVNGICIMRRPDGSVVKLATK